MKRKIPPRKRILGKSRRFFFSFCAGALLILSLLTTVLVLTADLSFEMDDALFRDASTDKSTRLYYYDTERETFLEWEEERVTSGGELSPVSLQEIQGHLSLAFIAAEDHRFYRHAGVDVLRTAKAMLNRILGGRKSFGGSTITQQLIKNIGGERERTARRKIREITRAQMLEMRHTKDEILTAYLNIVPMGEGCIGVGAAAGSYFGKTPSELTLAEAASLAAITPAPARLNPRKDEEAHLHRRNLVLSRMEALGYISAEECLAAQEEPLRLAPQKERTSKARSWYAERVLSEVKAGLVEKGYTESAANALILGGGLRIYTALDKRAQESADAAFSAGTQDGLHASCAVFSPQTGKLVALVGDLGEKQGARLFSYATDMRRAPGSVLKVPALYAPAIDEGRITMATVFDDVPQSFFDARAWPKNSPDLYDGLTLAKDALIHSKNTVAVSLCRLLGIEHIYGRLRDGFLLSSLVRRSTDADGRIETDLAEAPLALGELTRGVSLFEMTRAYLPFCMEGEIATGDTLLRVENAKGDVLLLGEEETREVISPQSASVITYMLKGVVEEGSARSLTLPDLVDTAGKTGSSGGNRDRWFIGYTPYYLTGIWCGYEKGVDAVSGTPHLSLFEEVMRPLHESLADDGLRSFVFAEGLHEVTVCKDSGKMQTVLCKEDARGDRSAKVLLPRSVQVEACHTHVSVFYDEEMGGVSYPPAKGREGCLKRVSLVRIEDRAFPMEVLVKDAEFVYRDPKGKGAPDGDRPFFAETIPDGVYIGKSHDGRPYNAAARSPLSPSPDAKEEFKERKPSLEERRLPPRPPRKRLPRFRFWGL